MDWTPKVAAKLDPTNMYQRVYEFPQQLQAGFNLPVNGDLSGFNPGQFRNIIVAGMGGSAIGGDFVRSYLANELTIPMYINRNYGLPRFVGADSLVIASSYSGNTEESLAAFEEAMSRGCKIVVATTGGKLLAMAQANNCPYIVLPGGFEPRAALGYSFGPILKLMQVIGFVGSQEQIVADTVAALTASGKKLAMNVPTSRNEAKKLAQKLKDKIGIVYAGADYYDVAAVRFKGQICENGKHLAYANIAPEFNHNELVGFDYPKALVRKLHVIWLTGPADSKGVTNRVKVVDKILKGKRIATVTVKAKGPNRLAEIFSLVQFGDLMSYYLALVNKTDPSPVHVINKLKTALEKMK